MVLLMSHSVDENGQIARWWGCYKLSEACGGYMHLTILSINIHSATMMTRCLVHNLHYLKS